MLLAYSSNAYTNHSIEEAIARVASLGYAGIEILADVPHAWPADMTPGRKQSILRTLDHHGLRIANVNAFMMRGAADPRHPFWHPSWIEPVAAKRKLRAEHTKNALMLAADLGAPSIQTEPGGPLDEDQSREKAMTVFYDGLMPCIELAERLGVMLLIEPEPGLLIERFEQYLALADRVDSPWLGLNFDIGHAYCVGEPPDQWVPRLAEHTRHYHIEDIAPSREHKHLVPGRGAIDLPAVLRAIQKTEYARFVTVELYPYIDDPDAAGREAKMYLDGILAEIINHEEHEGREET
ncbi:MAG: sugar phosphate isomerase/epimerase [Pirellulales bacterium]|nr:sugar phosphate isomerase/epimerase [Pirellulales bacterium]